MYESRKENARKKLRIKGKFVAREKAFKLLGTDPLQQQQPMSDSSQSNPAAVKDGCTGGDDSGKGTTGQNGQNETVKEATDSQSSKEPGGINNLIIKEMPVVEQPIFSMKKVHMKYLPPSHLIHHKNA